MGRLAELLPAHGLATLRVERRGHGFVVLGFAGRDPERLVLDDEDCRAALAGLDLVADLDQVLSILEAGGHESLEWMLDAPTGVLFLTAIHSAERGGPAGGIRRYEPDQPEIEIVRELARLSRAMTFKNAAADLPHGGSKLGVVAPPPPLEDPERAERYYEFCAYGIERSRSITGPDMGFTLADADP